MNHIDKEADLIAARLSDGPPPFEYSALYAAQQALRWAANPNGYARPLSAITGTQEDSGDCSVESRHSPLPSSDARMLDAA